MSRPVPHLNHWFESMVRSGTYGGCSFHIRDRRIHNLFKSKTQKLKNIMNYWLMKSEPGEFSIDDLFNRDQQREPWDGVRNYQARNMMRDEMQLGDQIFFYHSNCDLPGIVGIAEVASAAYPDDTAFDPDDKHFDPKSDPENPRWYLIDVRYIRKLKRVISLQELKACAELSDMRLVKRGNRLSVMPVTQQEWDFILALE